MNRRKFVASAAGAIAATAVPVTALGSVSWPQREHEYRFEFDAPAWDMLVNFNNTWKPALIERDYEKTVVIRGSKRILTLWKEPTSQEDLPFPMMILQWAYMVTDVTTGKVFKDRYGQTVNRT